MQSTNLLNKSIILKVQGGLTMLNVKDEFRNITERTEFQPKRNIRKYTRWIVFGITGIIGNIIMLIGAIMHGNFTMELLLQALTYGIIFGLITFYGTRKRSKCKIGYDESYLNQNEEDEEYDEVE